MLDTNQLTAYATVVLAVVGALAFTANVPIAIFTLRAARATRRSAEATEKAAVATQRSAEATEKAAVATQAEADATKEEASATKQMFAEVQIDRDLEWRPYLRYSGGGTTAGHDGTRGSSTPRARPRRGKRSR